MARPKKQPEIATPAGSLADEVPEQYVKIVDADPAAKPDILARVKELEAQLAEALGQRDEAQQKLVEQAAAQGSLMQTDVEEIPTGKTVPLRMLDTSYVDESGGARPGYKVVGYRDDAGGRPILQPVFKTVQVPTFYYKIDMPPCGGEALKINGIAFYHGTVVEVDLHLLRSIKEIVYRCWDHDRQIHGTDENAYRPKQRPTVSARAGR